MARSIGTIIFDYAIEAPAALFGYVLGEAFALAAAFAGVAIGYGIHTYFRTRWGSFKAGCVSVPACIWSMMVFYRSGHYLGRILVQIGSS